MAAAKKITLKNEMSVASDFFMTSRQDHYVGRILPTCSGNERRFWRRIAQFAGTHPGGSEAPSVQAPSSREAPNSKDQRATGVAGDFGGKAKKNSFLTPIDSNWLEFASGTQRSDAAGGNVELGKFFS